MPPGRHIFSIIASHWAPVYLDSGREIVDDMEASLGAAGLKLGEFRHILDFGCGCGRLIRHVHARTDAVLYGSDYNPDLVAWCDANLPFASFDINRLEPPFSYGAESFDFAYARSVFTHLPRELQSAWLAELHRVLKPGGVLYMTTHGAHLSARLDAEDRQMVERGEVVVTYTTVAGEKPLLLVRRRCGDGRALRRCVRAAPTPARIRRQPPAAGCLHPQKILICFTTGKSQHAGRCRKRLRPSPGPSGLQKRTRGIRQRGKTPSARRHQY